MSEKTITFAHSPDPDDAFMFYGFHTGAIKMPGYHIAQHMEDIQTLNERAFRGEFEVTAVSAHAYAHVSEKYWLLSCGASVGRGYGPTLIRPKGQTRWGNGRVAVPGKWTTAVLALDLWLAEERRHVEKIVIPFDKIIDVVKSGQFDAGLIIHEGQLTYEKEGLEKVWNAGEWWEDRTGLPLPLGVNAIRRDLGTDFAQQFSQAYRKSIEFAHAHKDDAVKYALQFGRGLNQQLGEQFIGMYVNDDTLKQGKDVQEGLKTLFQIAHQQKLIPQQPELRYI